jgi:hypothetical protein
MESKGWKNKKTSTIVGTETNPTKLESGQVVINKKATKQNLDRLIEINNDGLDKPIKKEVTTDGTEGGLLKGKAHYDENGNPLGGIPAVVDGAKKIETENDEFLLNKEASQKHWKELSKINQSTGNGVPINPSDVGADEDPKEFKDGGVIEFNPNKIPSRAIYAFAKKVKQKYPKVWDMGGNIFGNEAFNNLERVMKRGHWTESEEWMYIKWRSYVARHHKDFRIAGTIAMLKWVDKTDKGWPYMKDLIEKEIAKKYPKKGWKNKMAEGGGLAKRNLTYLGEVGGSKVSSSEKIDWGKNEFDQKIRFEISDENLKIIADLDAILKEILNEKKIVTIPLDSFIYHPTLFKAYPEFKNIAVNFIYTDKKIKALIRPDYKNNKIYFLFNIKQIENNEIRHLYSEGNRQPVRGNERYGLYLPQVAHELEHIIQIREIFGGGSSPISEQNRILRENGVDPETATEAQRVAIMVNAFDSYINKSGEIESKDVEKRLNLSLEERKQIKPFALMNIDKSKVSVLFPKKLNWEAMAEGGGVEFIPQQGTLLTKDKKLKLDYKKNGNNFEFVVYEGETNPVANYTKTSFKKKQNSVITMDYNQFMDYIYAEGYTDDKNYALGGGVGEYSYTEKDMDDFTNLLQQEIEKSGYITRVSKSKTNFGKSNYVFATNKEDDLYTPNEIKIRISDHSVSNYDRIFNEYHIVFPIEKKDYNQITEGVLKHIKYYFDRDKYFYSKEVNIDKKSYNVTTETPLNSDEITKEWVTKKGKKMYEVTRIFTNKATQWIDKKTNKVYTTINNKMQTGGGVEFIPEKKGTLIRGNEIIKYFEKVNGNYRLIFYTLNESKGKVPTMCDAFGYCEELDSENLTPKQLVELIKKNNLMEYGGELAKGIKSEQEHIDTAKKLYEHKINPSEAAKSIAKEHLKENPKYYSAMENIDFDKHYDEIKTKYADGGSVEPTYTLNTPSGEKSKLTYLQQVLVRTSIFKKFFGDWEGAAKRYLADNKENFKKHFENISKVMDMSILEPRVVYHGTRTEEQFFMFDVSKEKGVGRPYAYFAYNKEYSENFINFSQRSHSNSRPFLYDCFLNIRNPFWALGHAYEMKKRNHDYWINSIVGTIAIDKYDTVEKNAKTKKLEDAVKSQIEEYLIESAGNTNVSFWSFMARDTNSDFKYFLIAYGYDGIFYDEEFALDYDPENPKEYTRAVTVFTANDIKLADGKNLNFDPMNADIRFEQGGVPEQQAPIEHSLTKKEKLGNLLFGDKFARGGTANKEQSDVIYKEELPTNNRKFVDELIKKMKE